MSNFLRLTITLLSLCTISNSIAALGDVSSMTQTSKDRWDVRCLDGRQQRATTLEVLNNYICHGSSNETGAAQCYKAAIAPLGRFEYDDKNEIKQLQSACRRASFEVPKCIATATKKVGRFDTDDREEMIQIIGACVGGNGYTNQCLSVSSTKLGRFEIDDRDEMVSLINTCKFSRRSSTSCIDQMISSSSRNQVDDLEEVIEIIEDCR